VLVSSTHVVVPVFVICTWICALRFTLTLGNAPTLVIVAVAPTAMRLASSAPGI